MRQMQIIKEHRAGSGRRETGTIETPGELCQRLAEAAGVSATDVTGFIRGTTSLNDTQVKAVVTAAGGRRGWQEAIATLGLNLT